MKKKKGGVIKWIVIVVIALGIIGAVSGGRASDKKEDSKETSTQNAEKSGVTGIEVQKSEDETHDSIDDFRYEISGEEVLLKSYSGNDDILEIQATYVIENQEYQTNLTGFQVQNRKVKTLIIDEGIEEVQDSIFNSCDVENVYFPKSMIKVYDYTLAYLNSANEKTIKIYYGGTQEEWMNIFTEYQRTNVGDAQWGAEKGKALADKLNEMIGVEYDSSLFEYFFSASVDDLK